MDDNPSLEELGMRDPIVFGNNTIAYCLECGQTEDGPVTATTATQWNKLHDGRMEISEDQKVVFHCEACDIEEVVETGIFPEQHTDNFDTRDPGETTDLYIGGQEVLYRDIDERTTESAHIQYDSNSITTSHTHHLRIHALNPPTFRESNAYTVRIENYLELDMMLVNVKYHDSKRRTLCFVRGLDKGVLKTLEERRQD